MQNKMMKPPMKKGMSTKGPAPKAKRFQKPKDQKGYPMAMGAAGKKKLIENM